jgi:hypothetical protein
MSVTSADTARCADPKNNDNANLFGFFALLHRVDERNKREAMAVARTREDATSEKKKV